MTASFDLFVSAQEINNAEKIGESVDSPSKVLRAMLRMSLMEEGDAAMDYLISLCVESGFGICYRYVFSKEEAARKKARRQSQAPVEVICFPVEELREMK